MPAMCRSIKQLRTPEGAATEEEIRDAALQFVRKVSGYRAPPKRNAEAFDAAVDEVAEASRRLLEGISWGHRGEARLPSVREVHSVFSCRCGLSAITAFEPLDRYLRSRRAIVVPGKRSGNSRMLRTVAARNP